jgi:hypothetical protein
MFRFAGVVGLVAGALFGLPALASNAEFVATVKPVAGQVSISRGDGFKQITGSTQVAVGDQVMVGKGGLGKIVYSEGCVVDVGAGAVVGVAGSCKVAMAKPMLAGLEAAPVAAQAFPWGWTLTGAAVAVGVACIGFCQNNDNEHHHARRVSK